MKRYLKEFIRRKYYLWVVFALHRRANRTFRAIHVGIKKNNKSRKNIFNLRRDIHRIEKGLSYKNRRDVFAQDYISVVVDRLSQSISHNSIDYDTKVWAVAVLNEYFSVVKHEGKVKIAFEKFESLSLDNEKTNYIPYESQNRVRSDVTYDQLLSLSKQRRSVRFYTDQKVEKELVEKAVSVAQQSPSACNRQSFHFLYYDEQEIVNQITKIPGGVRGYTVPGVVAVVAKYEGYFEERDMFAPFIDSSLAVMSFILALETLGLSSVVINWSQNPLLDEKARKILPLSDDECVVMLVGVGYPDPLGKIPFSAKLPVAKKLLR